MKKLSLVLGLVLFAISLTLAQRTVTGTVTDTNGEPLIGASILVKNTTSGTVTDIDGTYSLAVPDGSTTLTFSYTGFNTKDVELGASDVLDVIMEEGIELNEVVVTGLGIKKEKKALGYGVSTISSADISARSEADVARILRGKATGVDITQTSGLAGSGTNVIIRGYSSISGSNQPLFVVDGVPFNTDTNADQGFIGGGATASSRFLDLDPNNIAEVSILKGLSATVLYGEAGRNGVVLITTKNGNVGGDADKKMEVSVQQQVSFTEVANLPDYQDTYGNGFSGNFGFFFSNWGPAFDIRGSNGISAEGTVPHPYDNPRYADDFPEFIGAPYSYQPYSSVEDFFDTGVSSNTSIAINKSLGNGAGISATYSYLSDGSFIPRDDNDDRTNFLDKHNLGLGARANLANGLNVKGTFNYVDSKRQNPPAASGAGSNPSGASLFANLVYTPRSIDLLNLPYQSPIDGRSIYYRSGNDIQNPLWTLNNARQKEDVRRFFGTIDLSYELLPWLTANYRLGVDQYTQQQRREINRGGAQIPDGTYQTSERLNRITDQVLNLSYNVQVNEDISVDGIVGANLRRETRDQTFAISTNQFLFDLFTHGNFIDHNNFSFLREENTIGAYVTASLGYKNFFYVNFQGRNDWTSTLESENNSIFYPSGSVSFVPTDAFQGLQNSNVINYLKVRAGYGTSAGYPNPYQTRNILGTQPNVFVTNTGSVLNSNTISDQLGNRNLKPELHSELEFGLEGRFLNNRVGIDFSYYDKDSKDLIINLGLDPSTGFTNTTVNAAEIENEGIELGLNLIPLAGDFRWDINLNYTRNRNIVQSVADGVDQVRIVQQAQNGLFTQNNEFNGVANWAIPGQPYGVIQGTPYRRLNGERVIGADGIPIPDADISVIGNPQPNFQANWINTFSYKGFSLNFQWQYIDGGDIYSLTTATMLARGNTVDTDFDRFLPVVFPGVKEDGTPNDTQVYLGDISFRAYFFANEGGIFDGTTIRLREVGLSYTFDPKFLDKTPFGSLSLRLNGENLFYKAVNFPEGVNYDPEVLSVGVGNGRGLEFITGPTARRVGATLSATF